MDENYSTDQMSDDQNDQSSVVKFLSTPDAFGVASDHVEIRETHISLIFLVGDRAYKLKKPVDLGYLDFSTLDKRRAACDVELHLNRRTAPQIYEALIPVTRDDSGQLSLDGKGKPVEWLIKMKRFDEAFLASNLAREGKLTLEMLEALAREIASFHTAATPTPNFGDPKAMGKTIASNQQHLEGFEGKVLASDTIKALQRKNGVALQTAADLLEKRRSSGYVRRCHGDLHLGNIFFEAARPVLFDCIEFSETMGSIDTLYDLAFLLMDLLHLNLRNGANRVLNTYLISLEMKDREANLEALSLLPLFLSVRAAIRSHVTAQTAQALDTKSREGGSTIQSDAQIYLDEALAFLDAAPNALVAVGGLSGSGKSTVARALAPNLGPAPGAIILRSDELRKRLSGKGPKNRLGSEAYTETMTRKVYDKMITDARIVLEAGHSVIVDAVHARPDERTALEQLAGELGVPFVGLWLDVPTSAMEARIAARVADASDATIEVLRGQLSYDLGEITWKRIDASGGLEETVRTASSYLD